MPKSNWIISLPYLAYDIYDCAEVYFRFKLEEAISISHPPTTHRKNRAVGHLKIPNAPCREYLPTFTINLCQMWVNIPYVEHLGIFDPKNPDPYGNTKPSVHDTPFQGLKTGGNLTPHDIPWSLRGNKIQLGWKWTNIWNHHLELIPLLNSDCPKNPNPSKVAILRSPKHILLYRFKAFHLRVQGFLGWTKPPTELGFMFTNVWNHHWLLLWFLWHSFGGRGKSCRPNNATGQDFSTNSQVPHLFLAANRRKSWRCLTPHKRSLWSSTLANGVKIIQNKNQSVVDMHPVYLNIGGSKIHHDLRIDMFHIFWNTQMFIAMLHYCWVHMFPPEAKCRWSSTMWLNDSKRKKWKKPSVLKNPDPCRKFVGLILSKNPILGVGL